MNRFTQNVRAELRENLPSAPCCRRALLFGLLINADCGIGGEVYIRSTGEDTTALILRLLRELYSREAVPAVTNCYGRYTAEMIVASEKLAAALSDLSEPKKTGELLAFLRCDLCRSAFCAGLLLSCSAIGDPEKGPRAEIRINDPVRAQRAMTFFENLGMAPSLSDRKGTGSLLFKRVADVEGLVTVAGAVNSAMALMQNKLVRELRGEINRTRNCELRNLSRTVGAARAQVEAIAALRAAGKLEKLPDELLETALLREKYPEISLTDLAARHDPPISKSGLNHRLEKIMKEAER